MTQVIGRVVDLAVRTRRPEVKVGPMQRVERVTAEVGAGLREDVVCTDPRRGLTLISAAQWAEVVRELAAELPWHTRRANVLIDAPDLSPLIGKTVRLGAVRLKVHDETRPCSLMDRLHQGLRAVLKPDCRAGVHGEVLIGGEIRVGDELVVEEE
jgi:MOSC domain-containing protein YiiM